jgi:hypothetical protein
MVEKVEKVEVEKKVEEVKEKPKRERKIRKRKEKATQTFIPLKLNVNECLTLLRLLSPTSGNAEERAVKKKITKYLKRVISAELRKI